MGEKKSIEQIMEKIHNLLLCYIFAIFHRKTIQRFNRLQNTHLHSSGQKIQWELSLLNSAEFIILTRWPSVTHQGNFPSSLHIFQIEEVIDCRVGVGY